MKIVSLIMNYLNRLGIEKTLGQVPASVKPLLTERAVSILEKPLEERRQIIMRSREEAYALLDEKSAVKKKALLDRYNASIRGVVKQITAPSLPELRMHVDYRMAEEKAKAELTRMVQAEEVLALPEVSKGDFMTASFLLTLSFFANLWFVTNMFGDALSSSDLIATVLNGVIALVITVAEMVGPSLLLSFLPDRFKSSAVRVLGIVGGAILVIGLIYLFMSRGELNNVVTTAGTGLVE